MEYRDQPKQGENVEYRMLHCKGLGLVRRGYRSLSTEGLVELVQLERGISKRFSGPRPRNRAPKSNSR